MAITRYSSFDVTVNTIADRNDILRKVNHMTVLVRDAVGDPAAGSGRATYRWNKYDNEWILISKSNYGTISFMTEELTITNGQVQLSNFPIDNQLWGLAIVQNDLIFTEPRLNELTINGAVVGGLNDYDSMSLKVTYAYGTMVQQIESVLASVSDSLNDFYNKQETESKILELSNNIDTYSKIEVDSKFENLINLAPSTLDTFKEIADKLSNDESVVNALSAIVDNKVDSVAGKTGNVSLNIADIVVNNHIIPTEDITFDLGSETHRFRDLWLSSNTIKMGNFGISVSETGTLTTSSIIDPLLSTDILTDADIGVNVQSYNSDTVIDENYIHTDNNFTTVEKSKLAGINNGAEVNVNADWNSTSGKSQILNKPTTVNGYGITDVYTKTQTDSTINSAITDLVNLAPTALDTLGEIAAQLANDESAVNALTTVVGNKVDKVDSITDSITVFSNNTGDIKSTSHLILNNGISFNSTGIYNPGTEYASESDANLTISLTGTSTVFQGDDIVINSGVVFDNNSSWRGNTAKKSYEFKGNTYDTIIKDGITFNGFVNDTSGSQINNKIIINASGNDVNEISGTGFDPESGSIIFDMTMEDTTGSGNSYNKAYRFKGSSYDTLIKDGISTLGKIGIGTLLPSTALNINFPSKLTTSTDVMKIDFKIPIGMSTTSATAKIGLGPNTIGVSPISAGAMEFSVAATNLHNTYRFKGQVSTQDITLRNGKIGVGIDTPTSKVTVQDGDVEITNALNGLILKSPNGTRYRLTVDDLGNLETEAV